MDTAMHNCQADQDRWLYDPCTINKGGERVSHLYRSHLLYAHSSIYDFAVPFCQGAMVLDAVQALDMEPRTRGHG